MVSVRTTSLKPMKIPCAPTTEKARGPFPQETGNEPEGIKEA